MRMKNGAFFGCAFQCILEMPTEKAAIHTSPLNQNDRLIDF